MTTWADIEKFCQQEGISIVPKSGTKVSLKHEKLRGLLFTVDTTDEGRIKQTMSKF